MTHQGSLTRFATTKGPGMARLSCSTHMALYRNNQGKWSANSIKRFLKEVNLISQMERCHFVWSILSASGGKFPYGYLWNQDTFGRHFQDMFQVVVKHLIFDANDGNSRAFQLTAWDFWKSYETWFVRIHRKLQHDNPPKLTG